MGLKFTDKDKYEQETDLSFPKVPDGRYVWQFLDGVFTKPQQKDPSKITYFFPIQVIEVVKGDSEALMLKATLMAGQDSKMLLDILAKTGQWDYALKTLGQKVGEDFEMDASTEKAQVLFKTKVPGKLIGLEHKLSTKKNEGGEDVVNINWLHAFVPGKGGQAKATQTQSTFTEVEE